MTGGRQDTYDPITSTRSAHPPHCGFRGRTDGPTPRGGSAHSKGWQEMMRFGTRRAGVAILAVACAAGMAACSSSSTSSTKPSTSAVKSGGTATVSLDEALAGFNINQAYKDVGGKAYIPASTAGYSQIKSITGSNNGKTVTVVFSSPFSDWKSLFADLMPAHIASKVGFNNGFQ